jgi:FkbM family methyltransferase
LDNNKQKWGSVFDGVDVIDPAKIVELSFDVVILASAHAAVMAKQLTRYGVCIERMLLGANFALNKEFACAESKINFVIDSDFNLVSADYYTKQGLMCVDWVAIDKRVIFGPRNIPTMLALCGGGNKLPHFIQLARQYGCGATGLFVDVGANIGTTSINACNYDIVERCVAFEPATDNFTLLRSNVAINALDERIESHHLAIGSDDDLGGLELTLSNICSGDNRIQRSEIRDQRSECCSVITIDQFFADILDQVRFLWVDVQGYEYHVLRGCQELLKRNSVFIQIEFWPQGLMETGTLDLLNALLTENFKYFVDMAEYDGSNAILHDISDITRLSSSLTKIGPNAHTDIFLLR